MTKVIFLNGPPRSGKDTSAILLKRFLFNSNNIHSVKRMGFADHLKNATHASLGLDLPFDHYEAQKSTPLPDFFGKTPREAYIAHSELYMKPVYGLDIYGQLWLRAAIATPNVAYWLIPDSGFTFEAQPVMEHYGVGNCLLIRLHREGYDYKGDSRSYITLPCKTIDIQNNASVTELEVALRNAVGTWLQSHRGALK